MSFIPQKVYYHRGHRVEHPEALDRQPCTPLHFPVNISLAIISLGSTSDDTAKEKYATDDLTFIERAWVLFCLSNKHGLPESLRYVPSSIMEVGICFTSAQSLFLPSSMIGLITKCSSTIWQSVINNDKTADIS